MPLINSCVEQLSPQQCRELLATVEIGRVVMSIDALPAALPVAFTFIDDDDTVVFRTAPGAKLDAALNRTVVGFEVDELDASTRSGWSVMIVGVSAVVSDPAEVVRLAKRHVHSWVGDDLPHLVRVEIAQISGRRIPVVGGQG